MPEKREVGFPEGQFIAHGVDEDTAVELSDCWRTGDHKEAQVILDTELLEPERTAAINIYERLKSVEPREGLYE